MDASRTLPDVPGSNGSAATAPGDALAFDTLAELWRARVAATPEDLAYQWYEASTRSWSSLTWKGAGRRVDTWSKALAREGFAHGARIAILLPNGIDNVTMDQAALALGQVPLPMHAIDNPDSIAFILKDSEASLLIIDSRARWDSIAAVGDGLKGLKRIIHLDEPGGGTANTDPRVVTLAAWLKDAEASPAPSGFTPATADDLAALVFTSGTTGRPKGVMLTHRNVVANVRAILKCLLAEKSDVFLSFLPLSHTFERTAGYYYAIATGAAVAYARSARDLPEDLKMIRPTILASVPRIYERFYAAVQEHQSHALAVTQYALRLTVEIGNRRFEARQGRGPALTTIEQALWPILKSAAADRVLQQLGGRLRVAVSGGAPISENIIRFFLALGLDVLQGYGMTETSPVVATNTPLDNDPRTVGRPIDGVEVKIGANNELMVKGPNVMKGYWHNEAETRRVLEPDGWLHTGDQASISSGRITITGRIKDIIVTSTGEKFPPADLETAIMTDPLFEQVMVVGENKPFVSALVVLNAKLWQRTQQAAQGRPEAEVLLEHIRAAAKDFPAYAMPRAVWWSTEPWTIEAALLTPTLKIKRNNVAHHFANEIEAMYAHRPTGETAHHG